MNDVFDLVIDVQNDFMRPDGALYVPGAETIIAPLQQHIATRTSRGILFTYDTHELGVYENSEEAKQFPIHCVRGSPGWQLAIDPGLGGFTLEKGVFDMWHEPRLLVHGNDAVDRDVFFDDLAAAGVTTLRLCGVASDYCVKWAIDGALARSFKVHVIAGLTKGIARDMAQVIKDEFGDQEVSLVSLN